MNPSELLQRFTDLLQRPPVTWWDVLDILVVAILIYELLKLIRGTRAVQMAVGIAAIVGLFYLSRAGLQLENAEMFDPQHHRLRRVAVSCFQADIRRALINLGRGKLFRRLDRKVSDDDTVEELVVAATTLSVKKTGAIVWSRAVDWTSQYIESGIHWMRSGYDLLVSIFQPTSPLHDGAGDHARRSRRAAACFLPLTTNHVETRAWFASSRRDWRHEENDAVAIVVSEETGTSRSSRTAISSTDIDPERLRARLRSVVTLRRAANKDRQAGYSLSDGVHPSATSG